MISFLTFSDAQRFSRTINDQEIMKEASVGGHKTVFLSHSSKDNALVPSAISILNNHGASVYVDIKDTSLPSVPSIDTAKIIRSALGRCRKFVLLVSTNSQSSKWIPWELGISDGEKSPASVALLPVSESSNDQKWAEQEYLDLYDRIIWGNFEGQAPEWLVYNHHFNNATRLREWLSR